MSSCSRLGFRCVVRPGGRLVVEGAGFEAAVLDADEAVGELAQGGVVLGAAGALVVVVGACPGEAFRAANAWVMSASMSRSLWTYRAMTVFFLPEARVMGLVPASFLRALAEAYRAGSSPDSAST